MLITIIATLMIMSAYFLLLYGVVAFVQDKRFLAQHLKRILMPFPTEKRDFPVLML